jgi:hypothetical protein
MVVGTDTSINVGAGIAIASLTKGSNAHYHVVGSVGGASCIDQGPSVIGRTTRTLIQTLQSSGG